MQNPDHIKHRLARCLHMPRFCHTVHQLIIIRWWSYKPTQVTRRACPMGLRRGLGAVCAAALAHSAAAMFSTTLHGAPTQTIEPGTPGAATLELQPWLTTIDPDVRARSACTGRAKHGLCRFCAPSARSPAPLCSCVSRFRPCMCAAWCRARGLLAAACAVRGFGLGCWRPQRPTLLVFLCSCASLTLAVPLGVLPFLSGPAGCVQRCATSSLRSTPSFRR